MEPIKPISSTAQRLIEDKLSLMINSGKDIRNINLRVSHDSEIARLSSVETKYGTLLIRPGDRIPLGKCFLVEKPLTIGGIGIAWVNK